jgi:chromosome segregation ATPase
MAMEMVLKDLEERIDTIVKAYAEARALANDHAAQIQTLEAKVAELETALADGAEAAEKAGELEQQKQQLAERLEGIIAAIDDALTRTEDTLED